MIQVLLFLDKSLFNTELEALLQAHRTRKSIDEKSPTIQVYSKGFAQIINRRYKGINIPMDR